VSAHVQGMHFVSYQRAVSFSVLIFGLSGHKIVMNGLKRLLSGNIFSVNMGRICDVTVVNRIRWETLHMYCAACHMMLFRGCLKALPNGMKCTFNILAFTLIISIIL
jgi:hypothetical protein